jgi:ribokinase
MSAIVVVGSLNMDLVLRVPRIPAPGETILGDAFQMLPGGKGANQAYAAAKLGGDVSMIGRVGRDNFGDRLRANLASVGVEVSDVRSTDHLPTGVATITVDSSGQNAIVVASGANFAWQPRESESIRGRLRGSLFALFQLETPLDFVAAALRVAKDERVTTVLDPAPAVSLPHDLLETVDILTPNESEALILLGENPRPLDPHDASAIATRLHERGASRVLLKLGSLGSFYSNQKRSFFVEPYAVQAVDTTAAGDTFNAALAVALSERQPIEAAMRFANRAAALSVTRLGAQSSAPSRDEVDAL